MAEEVEKKQGEDGAQQKAEGEGKKDSTRIIFIAIVAGIIVLNAVMAFVLVRATMPKPEKQLDALVDEDSAEAAKEEIGAIAFAEPPIEAIVNIKGSEGMRFLKTVIVLAYDAKKYGELGTLLEERNPEIKNLVIDRLSSRSLDDLQRPSARDEIRAELKRMINKSLPKAKKGLFAKKEIGHVADVYINEFIIQ